MVRDTRRLSRRYVLLFALLLTLLAFAATASGNLSGSPFDAGDGNLVRDEDETQDWANAPNLQKGIDLPTGQTDNSFGQGAKEDTEVPSVVDGSIPNNKSDLTRFYVANQRVATKEFLYLAWERVQEPSGTTNMDFEFNQSTTLSSNNVTPVRTAGDVLIKYDLAQGGTNPVLGFHRWVTSGNCEANGQQPPCWGPVQSLGGNFEGSLNSVSVTDPIPPDEPRSLSARTFGEAAINLTDSGILPAGTCAGFGRAYLKSRSSDSFTAALKDFIAPISVNIQNCGTIIITKDAVPNDAQDFSFTGDIPGCTVGPLDDDSDGTLSHTVTCSSVLTGTYSVQETPVPSGWSLTDLTCTDPSGGTTTNTGTGTASIDLAVGETVSCTYTNKKDATVQITKDAVPNDPQDFAYAVTGSGWSGFSLDDDSDGTLLNTQTFTFSGSNFGSKTVTETVPSGWSLTSLTCSEGTTNLGTGQASFTVDPGDTITCTYTNTSKHVVIVLVCHQGTNTLFQSSVQIDPAGGAVKQSLGAGATLPDGVSEAELCGLGGASFADLNHITDRPFDVTIPTGGH